MNVYVASRFTNKEAVRKVYARLKELGHEVAHDWTNDSLDSIPTCDQDEYLRKNAVACLDGILNSHCLIMLHKPEMKGAYVELGFAIGNSVPVIVVDHELTTTSPIFYHLTSPTELMFKVVKDWEEVEDQLTRLNEYEVLAKKIVDAAQSIAEQVPDNN